MSSTNGSKETWIEKERGGCAEGPKFVPKVVAMSRSSSESIQDLRSSGLGLRKLLGLTLAIGRVQGLDVLGANENCFLSRP